MGRIYTDVCDRCGKPLNKKEGWTSRLKFWPKKKINRKVYLSTYFCGNNSGYDYTENEWELCDDCTRKLIDFLKEYPKNDN